MTEIQTEMESEARDQLPLGGLSILLIEDDLALLRSLGARIADQGADIILAADGAAGLEAFNARHFDIVVTDIVMPEREGVETIMAIKRESPRTPVLAISGGGRLGGEEFLKLAKRLGADATLAKPFRSDDLLAALKRLVPEPMGR